MESSGSNTENVNLLPNEKMFTNKQLWDSLIKSENKVSDAREIFKFLRSEKSYILLTDNVSDEIDRWLDNN